MVGVDVAAEPGDLQERMDARLQPLLDIAAGRPALSGTVAEQRLVADARAAEDRERFAGPVMPVGEVTTHMVEVSGGAIGVRLYFPQLDGGSKGEGVPVHVHLHPGGWWRGTLEASDRSCREMAALGGCIVASVEYRLAPENRFPVPFTDCYEAVCWIADNASTFGGDAARLSIGGVSAGANLAAAVTVHAVAGGGPTIIAQVLQLPVLDLSLNRPSVSRCGQGFFLTEEAIRAFAAHYLGPDGDARDPRASPLLADHRGLPRALVLTAELDPVGDDGADYARSLRQVGVEVVSVCFPGMIHITPIDVERLVPDVAEASRGMIASFLRETYETACG